MNDKTKEYYKSIVVGPCSSVEEKQAVAKRFGEQGFRNVTIANCNENNYVFVDAKNEINATSSVDFYGKTLISPSEFLNNGWHEVVKDGWPKEEDYPVLVWHPEIGVSCAKYKAKNDSPCTIGVLDIMNPWAACRDDQITHWKRFRPDLSGPYIPKPKTNPKLDSALANVKKARKKLEKAERELEEARSES